jgi:Caspase domain
MPALTLIRHAILASLPALLIHTPAALATVPATAPVGEHAPKPATAQAAKPAAAHALILTIDYGNTAHALTGITADKGMAVAMAQRMGIPNRNIILRRNGSLDLAGMKRAFATLEARVAPGDAVFIYYSGHGRQGDKPRPAKGENKCTEALVTSDLRSYPDYQLEAVLSRLAQKARTVLMLNDSCFSGGQATRPLGSASTAQIKTILPKAGVTNLASGANAPGYDCGTAINPLPLKNFFEQMWDALTPTSAGTPNRPRTKHLGYRARLLYLAASSDNEYSFATPNGSRATRAWSACLQQNPNQSGNDFLRCAQGLLNGNGPDASPADQPQTINLLGDGSLLMNLAADGADAATPANPARPATGKTP